MGAQPFELLADIGASHEHRHLLRNPLVRHARGEIGKTRQGRLQPLANRGRLSRRASPGRSDERRQLVELAPQQPGKPRALLRPGGGQSIKRQCPAVEHSAPALLDQRFGFVLQAGWGGLDLARELLHQRDELGQRLAVDAHRRRSGTGDREAGRKAASAKALGKRGAELGLERIKSGGEAEAQVDRLAVDAFQLPYPGDPELVALRPGEPRHAGYTHRRLASCLCRRGYSRTHQRQQRRGVGRRPAAVRSGRICASAWFGPPDRPAGHWGGLRARPRRCGGIGRYCGYARRGSWRKHARPRHPRQSKDRR